MSEILQQTTAQGNPQRRACSAWAACEWENVLMEGEAKNCAEETEAIKLWSTPKTQQNQSPLIRFLAQNLYTSCQIIKKSINTYKHLKLNFIINITMYQWSLPQKHLLLLFNPHRATRCGFMLIQLLLNIKPAQLQETTMLCTTAPVIWFKKLF